MSHTVYKTSNGRFNWSIGRWNTLYYRSLVLAIWTWACHLEVEWAAFHSHLHGNEYGLQVPDLTEGGDNSTSVNNKTKRLCVRRPDLPEVSVLYDVILYIWDDLCSPPTCQCRRWHPQSASQKDPASQRLVRRGKRHLSREPAGCSRTLPAETETGQHLCWVYSVYFLFKSVNTNPPVLFLPVSLLGKSEAASWRRCICNLKCSLCHTCGTVNPLFRSGSELCYLSSDWPLDLKAWQVKYSTSMRKGAGMAVWLVIINCFVTALFKMTSSPKSINSVRGLSSSGGELKMKEQRSYLRVNRPVY